MTNATDLVREMRDALSEVRPTIPREVLELWCADKNAIIAKADAYLKESEESVKCSKVSTVNRSSDCAGFEAVKYGCHKGDHVSDECAIDTNSTLCIAARALSRNGLTKEHCSYWRRIK